MLQKKHCVPATPQEIIRAKIKRGEYILDNITVTYEEGLYEAKVELRMVMN